MEGLLHVAFQYTTTINGKTFRVCVCGGGVLSRGIIEPDASFKRYNLTAVERQINWGSSAALQRNLRNADYILWLQLDAKQNCDGGKKNTQWTDSHSNDSYEKQFSL